MDEASFVLGIHDIGVLIGMSVAGRLIEQLDALAILFPGFLIGALLVGTLGYAAASVPIMPTVLFLIGMFVGAGASGSIAVAALTYPTAMRSSGIGWAMGMGRFGQVLAPLPAMATVAAGWTDVQVFYRSRPYRRQAPRRSSRCIANPYLPPKRIDLKGSGALRRIRPS